MDKEAIQQSQEAYIAQFDPTSSSYHGGATTPVPLGGTRIPQSMSEQHPDNFNSTEVQPTSQQLGQEILMTNLKKLLDKISPHVEAIFRHNENYKTKADKTKQKHVQLHKMDISKQEKQIQKLEAQILQTSQKLIQSNEEFFQFKNQIIGILTQSHTHFQTKQQLTDFGFKVKRLTAKIFSKTKKQLQELKKIKNNFKVMQNTLNQISQVEQTTPKPL